MIQEREATTIETPNQKDANKPLSTADLVQRAEPAPTRENSSSESGKERMPLFAGNELGGFRVRWHDIQTSFVDEPRTAVRNADELVASVMTRLAQVFADEREKLEHDWDKGENVSTEELRIALQRYRSFFDRLLSV